METKIKNLIKSIVTLSDRTQTKRGTNSDDLSSFEYKEVKMNLPLEVIEELRKWVNEIRCND